MTLTNEQAKYQLRLLRGLKGHNLEKKANLVQGYFREEPYLWVAFDNTTGELWISRWQNIRDAQEWLIDHDYEVETPTYCWFY